MSSVNHKPIVINNMATNKAIFSNLQSIQKCKLLSTYINYYVYIFFPYFYKFLLK